jgi:tRNA(Arg) A34 adenosine deaminase TadA
MRKFIKTLLIIIGILLIITLIFKSQIFRISGKTILVEQHKKELTNLALTSLQSNDLPIGAVLLYNYKIIGRGYNTVELTSNAGEHAVINAISDAMKNIGLTEFSKLNPKSMLLITTMEPCLMCKGALEEYGITEVEFIKENSLLKSLNTSYNELLYEIHKKKTGETSLQDSLFQLYNASNQDSKLRWK